MWKKKTENAITLKTCTRCLFLRDLLLDGDKTLKPRINSREKND